MKRPYSFFCKQCGHGRSFEDKEQARAEKKRHHHVLKRTIDHKGNIHVTRRCVMVEWDDGRWARPELALNLRRTKEKGALR